MKDSDFQVRAFTLIELMVVVLVISVLAAVAVPSYQKYIVKARMAEAYQNLGILTRREISNFVSNGEFHTLNHNPVIWYPGVQMSNISEWNPDWYPVELGNYVHFSYSAFAGKTNSSGTEIFNSSVDGGSFMGTATSGTYIRRTLLGSNRCNNQYDATTFGVIAQSNYDWVIISAVSDMDNNLDSTCTAVSRLIEAKNPSRVPTSQGFALFNVGN